MGFALRKSECQSRTHVFYPPVPFTFTFFPPFFLPLSWLHIAGHSSGGICFSECRRARLEEFKFSNVARSAAPLYKNLIYGWWINAACAKNPMRFRDVTGACRMPSMEVSRHSLRLSRRYDR